jgi:hypothetical protein
MILVKNELSGTKNLLCARADSKEFAALESLRSVVSNMGKSIEEIIFEGFIGGLFFFWGIIKRIGSKGAFEL